MIWRRTPASVLVASTSTRASPKRGTVKAWLLTPLAIVVPLASIR